MNAVTEPHTCETGPAQVIRWEQARDRKRRIAAYKKGRAEDSKATWSKARTASIVVALAAGAPIAAVFLPVAAAIMLIRYIS